MSTDGRQKNTSEWALRRKWPQPLLTYGRNLLSEAEPVASPALEGSLSARVRAVSRARKAPAEPLAFATWRSPAAGAGGPWQADSVRSSARCVRADRLCRRDQLAAPGQCGARSRTAFLRGSIDGIHLSALFLVPCGEVVNQPADAASGCANGSS